MRTSIRLYEALTNPKTDVVCVETQRRNINLNKASGVVLQYNSFSSGYEVFGSQHWQRYNQKFEKD